MLRTPLPRRADIVGLKDTFASEFGVHWVHWSGHNLTRMVNFASPDRASRRHSRSLLGHLGLGERLPAPNYDYLIAQDGVFDHGEMWVSKGMVRFIVGHPYYVSDTERDLLTALAGDPSVTGFRTFLDDRPSHYGHGTHHVRVELANHPDAPWS